MTATAPRDKIVVMREATTKWVGEEVGEIVDVALRGEVIEGDCQSNCNCSDRRQGLGGFRQKGQSDLQMTWPWASLCRMRHVTLLLSFSCPFAIFPSHRFILPPFSFVGTILSLTSSCVEIFAARIIVHQNRPSPVDIARIYCNTLQHKRQIL